MRRWFQKIYPYVVNVILVLVLFYFLSAPFFEKINNFFSDLLQGEIPARSEIVIVGIDDKSLKEVDTLPWKREVTADLLQKILESSPKVVGLDILLLDRKEGDDALARVMEQSKVPIVLGAKYEDNTSYTSFFTGEKVVDAYINFPTDVDGKVRDTFQKYGNKKSCLYSFSYALYQLYRGTLKTHVCEPAAGQESIAGLSKTGLSYSRAPFKTISAADVLSGNVNKKDLENKIVIIGATPTDIAATLSDNFFDIFGRKVSGVYIHAQAANTYMQNVSLWYASYDIVLFSMLFLTTVFLYFLRRSPTMLGFIYFVVTEIFVVVTALILYEFGVIIPAVTVALLILATYILMVGLKYVDEFNKNRVISDSFSKYVNPHILQKIIFHPELLKLGGEKRKMTVLFCDIRNFTSLSEKLTPEATVDLLNEYLEGLSGVILAHEGTIDKYIGDAIMAFWNAPTADSKHALHGILAALEMRDFIEKQNKKSSMNEKLSIGIGINTGEMIVGNVGSKKRFDFTVLGDQVNLASRLEGLTKKYKVFAIVAEGTVNALGNDLEGKVIFRQLDVVQVKGREESVAIYEPLEYTPENLELANRYIKAFLEYQKGAFDDAKILFADIEDDLPSQMMVDRIQKLRENDKEFAGVWVWDEK